jgi:CubicO group peptidase (beta-lactamase class C family)
MTQEQRDYLARTDPARLRAYDRGDWSTAADMQRWLDENSAFISEWSRANPETWSQQREREIRERENEGAAGW